MRLQKIFIIVITNLFLLAITSTSLACWGTRPLAMGGAFSGVADDINAIYWNPAGLALSNRAGITTMHNIGERNDSNYDQYLGATLPLGDYGTLGAAFVYNKDVIFNANGSKNGTRQDTYYQLGYGTYLKKDWNLSVGVSVKAVTKDRDTTTSPDQDKWFDLDIGALWAFGSDVGTKKMFSLGFLLQNAYEAQLLKRDETTKMVRNFRPGIGFHPDEKTTLALDVYDAFGETRNENTDVSQNLRLGVERWVHESVVLRLGGYHTNNESMRAYTGGIGLKAPSNWNMNLEIDWTIMYWDQANTATHFVGLTYLF